MVTIEIDLEMGPVRVTTIDYAWQHEEDPQAQAWAEFLNGSVISPAGPGGESVDPDITAAGQAVQLLKQFGVAAKIVATTVPDLPEEDTVAGRVY